jgi:uncharacterized protein YjcR
MPRAPSGKSDEAKALYIKGMKQVDIARKLGVPEGTVRRWKHDQDWDGNNKKNKANVRKKIVKTKRTFGKEKAVS